MAKTKKGLSTYKLEKIKKNLMYWYNQASKEQTNNGGSWYNDAHNFCKTRAQIFGVSPQKVAEVVSALSPQNKWERNLIDADAVLCAWRDGDGPEAVKVCTFDGNKKKAFNILAGSVVNWGPKTAAFVSNISQLDGGRVTIDRHHLRACFSGLFDMNKLKSLTDLKYKQIEAATLELASAKGLQGYKFQAIVWEAIR